MKLKGLKKRLNALKPLEKTKEPPQWRYEYVNSITIERWKTISGYLKQYKQGITINTEVLGMIGYFERVNSNIICIRYNLLLAVMCLFRREPLPLMRH